VNERIREVDLHLTNRCNLVCAHCSVDSGTGRSSWDEMPVEQWLRVIDEAARLGCRYVDLTGGEPILFSGVERIVERVVQSGMHVELQSNGLLLTAERLRELKRAGLGTLVISLDGPESQHDLMRGRAGVYRSATKAIREAISTGFQVRVTRVFDHTSCSADMGSFVADLDRIGVSHLSINMFSPVTTKHFAHWQKPSAASWLATVDLIEQLARQVRLPITYEVAYAQPGEVAELFAEETRCLIERRRWFLIRCDGEVYPCYHFVHRAEMSLGSIRRTPLSGLIGDEGGGWDVYADIGQLPSGCTNCSFGSTCGGGCPSPGYLNMSSLAIKDVRCEVEHGFIPVCPFVKRRAGSKAVTNISPYYAS